MKNKCPKKVLRAVRDYARAVKRVSSMADLPEDDPQTVFHVVEYLPDMETLLIHQLLTALPTMQERKKVLRDFGLDYLVEEMEMTERDWEDIDLTGE